MKRESLGGDSNPLQAGGGFEDVMDDAILIAAAMKTGDIGRSRERSTKSCTVSRYAELLLGGMMMMFVHKEGVETVMVPHSSRTGKCGIC